jgi:plastocyanin domain-containing protein
MFEFLKRRLKSEKGAMDKILVTLLLVIVGVGAVIGLNQWITDESGNVQEAATERLQEVTADAGGGEEAPAEGGGG